MKRTTDYPLQKVTLNLRLGDWGWLRTMHGRAGASKVIREMVKGHVERSKMAAQQARTDPQLNLPLDAILDATNGAGDE